MNDTNGVAVTPATAQKYHLKSLSDLAKVGSKIHFAAYPDCKGRPDCLGGLQNTYHIKFGQISYVDSAPILYKGLQDGTYNAIEVFTTDGPLQGAEADSPQRSQGYLPGRPHRAGGARQRAAEIPKDCERPQPAGEGADHLGSETTQRPGCPRQQGPDERRPAVPEVKGASLATTAWGGAGASPHVRLAGGAAHRAGEGITCPASRSTM